MTDLASLAIKVDASDADDAARSLEKLTDAGRKTNVTVDQAERYMRKASIALDKMGDEAAESARQMKGASSAASDMANEAMRSAERATALAKGNNAAAFAARNLSYQVSDVITQLASGQKPMQVFAQQGFQIADALGQLAAAARNSDKSMLAMVSGPLAKFGPALLAAGVAIGGVAAALKVMQDDINASSEVTVSFGDVAIGVFDGIVAYVRDKLGPIFEWVANAIADAWQYVAAATKSVFNTVVTIATAAPNYIIAAFRTLPQAIAEFFVNAANGAIKAIEDLVNKAIAGLNKFAGMINGLLGTSLGGIGGVSFGRIENNFVGAGSRLGEAMAQATANTFRDHFSDAVAYFKPFITSRAGSHLENEAAAAGGKAGRAGGAAAGKEMAEKLVDTFAETMKGLQSTLAKIMVDAAKAENARFETEWADMMRAINDNYSDAAKGAKEAAEANARWNEELDQTLQYLGRIGGIGGGIANALSVFAGLTSGDLSRINGPIGGIIGLLGQSDSGKLLVAELGDKLTQIFGPNGPFGNTLAQVFQGAGVGAGIGTVLGGGKAGQLGGMLGGAAGQAIGSAIGGVAGPIGAIAGAILGNVLGSALAPTKRGGAVISGGSVAGTFGNSGGRIDASTSLAEGVLDSLSRIADALGGSLGAFNAVIGIREDSLRYNSTGVNSTKTSKGAIDFGKDEEALLKYAIKDAIAQGTFEGLTDGVKRLIEAPGDIEAQLQKALDLRGVYSDLAQAKDPQGFQLDQLEQWRDRMIDIATEAGEGMAEVEELYGLRRKEILEQFGADDNARRELEIALLIAQGKEVQALAAARQMELDAMPEALRALQQQVWAEQDAAEKRAAMAERERAIGQERQALNLEYLRMIGRTEQVRKIELAAIDESNRHLQERIWALQDEQEAAAALAAQQRAAASERAGIETRIHQLLGNTAMLRALELDALDPANRALQQHYYNLVDQADAADRAARATADLAAQQQAVANERYGLETRLLQAMGDTAALRARELETLDETNRPLLKQIYAIEDYKAAQEQAAQVAQEAADATINQNNALIASYNEQASAASRLASTFRGLAEEIRAYRAGLFGNASGAAQGEFQRISRMAALGDENSLRAFTGSADRYLEEARNSAGTLVEYQRAIGLVARAADQAANGADGVARMAESQLAAANAQVAALQYANELAQLEADAAKAQAEENIKALAGIEDKQDAVIEEIDFSTTATVETLESVKASIDALRQQIATQRADEQAESVSMVSALNDVSRRLSRWDRGDYVAVGNDTDTPITTVTA